MLPTIIPLRRSPGPDEHAPVPQPEESEAGGRTRRSATSEPAVWVVMSPAQGSQPSKMLAEDAGATGFGQKQGPKRPPGRGGIT